MNTKIQLAGCAIIKQNKLLLLWKNKHGHYEFPGGKVEQNETFEQTAKRETKEEIGVDVDIIKYVGYKEFSIDNKEFQSHKYLAKIKKGQTPKIMEPETFKEIFWLPIKRYKEYKTAPNVKQFCEDYIKNI